jgi:hypothetical protein
MGGSGNGREWYGDDTMASGSATPDKQKTGQIIDPKRSWGLRRVHQSQGTTRRRGP